MLRIFHILARAFLLFVPILIIVGSAIIPLVIFTISNVQPRFNELSLQDSCDKPFFNSLASIQFVQSFICRPTRLSQLDNHLNIYIETNATETKVLTLSIRGDGESRTLYDKFKVEKGSQYHTFTITIPQDPANPNRWYKTFIYLSESEDNIPTSSGYMYVVEVTPQSQSTMDLLMTTTAIILTLLALWMRLTVRFVNENTFVPKKRAATLNLYWLYIAAGFALIAFIVFLSQHSQFKFTPYFFPGYFVGLGLVCTSVIMVSLNVLESVISLALKGWQGYDIFDSLGSAKFLQNYYRWSFIVINLYAVLLLIFSIMLFSSNFESIWIICLGIQVLCAFLLYFICHIKYFNR